ncbi:hypothetical protein ACN4EE_20950 [Geminocystis sp. CENA526]|uniref:hypothetical protein n=1 Tax=Geminocystis sp. CENA526 TaxID=1355871 RepID=UPI003D6DFBD1
MNKYFLLIGVSIVTTISYVKSAQSSPLCYLIDANGNQINLSFICESNKPETSTNSTVTTPPPPTATNNPPVSPNGGETETPPNATPANTPEAKTEPDKPQVSPARRLLPVLNNQTTPNTTN